MGGNAKAVHPKSHVVKLFDGRLAYAEKIDLKKHDPRILVADVVQLLEKLNVCGAWDPSSLYDKKVFFGSFDCLVDPNVPIEEFVERKRELGDIDVAVTDEGLVELQGLLSRSEERKITTVFTYVGQNRSSYSGHSTNAVFMYERILPGTFVQIDFEASDFVDDRPAEFVKFIKSSPWEDTKAGVKGLAHKFLLSCIIRTLHTISNGIVLTEKSPLHPSKDIRVRNLDEDPVRFSLSKDGLREKFVRQSHAGIPVMVEGRYAYKEVPRKTAQFDIDLDSIFRKIFSRPPSNQDRIDFRSFEGLMNICQRTMSSARITTVFEHMVMSKLWLSGQQLSRDHHEEDREKKLAIVRRMLDKFPFLEGKFPLEEIMRDYYSTYEEREKE